MHGLDNVKPGNKVWNNFFHRILQLLNKRKLEKLKERWWNQNPEKRRDCEKQDDQTDGISIQNIGTWPWQWHWHSFFLTRHLHKFVKSYYWLQYFCLSTWKKLGFDGRIFMKFSIKIFFETLSRKFKFLKKIWFYILSIFRKSIFFFFLIDATTLCEFWSAQQLSSTSCYPIHSSSNS